MTDVLYGAGGWVRAADAGIPATVSARLDEQGRVVELHVRADGGLTLSHLRRLRLDRLQASAATRPDLLAGMGSAPDPRVRETVDSAFPIRSRRRPPVAATLRPPGADGMTDAFLRDVAAAYRAAVARGERPNVALHRQVGNVSKRTVEHWVRLARLKGYLPPGRQQQGRKE